MAAFVKSVEEVTLTVNDGTTLQTTDAALTNGQIAAKCVPFFTMRYTEVGTNTIPRQNQVSVEIFDNAGTPTVRARRRPNGDGLVECRIYVIEFADSVTVQSGVTTVTGLGATETISSVVQDNSFIVCNGHQVANDLGSWGGVFIAASFNSNTEIALDRDQDQNDMEVYWYVVTSNGVDFTTEHFEENFTSTSQTISTTLSQSVNLDNAFTVQTWSLAGFTSWVGDWGHQSQLTSSTNSTWYRNHGGTGQGPSGTISVFVVNCDATGAAAQHITHDAEGALITNETITAVDLSKAAIICGNSPGSMSGYPIRSGSGSSQHTKLPSTIGFTSTTNVQAQRQDTITLNGNNNNHRYDVVEFELATGGIEYTLTADQGSFAFSGLAAGTNVGRQVDADQGGFSFSGQDVDFQTDRLLTAEVGAYGFTGLNANLETGQSLSAETGTFAFAGQDANFAGDAVLMAEIGTFGFAGLNAGLEYTASIQAELGAYGFTGEDAKLVAEYQPAAETGAYGFTGLPAEFRVTDSNTLPAGTGGYAFDGQMANFYYGYCLKAETGSYSFKGLPAQLPSDEENYAGLPTWRKPKRKKRRYILPDNRVFEDADRALFELRQLLLRERQEQTESDGGEVQPVVSLEPSGAALKDPPSDTLGPTLMGQVLQELPALVEERPANLDPIDPQLLSVLLQMIDDEEAAMLLL